MTIKKLLANFCTIDPHEAEILLAHTLGKPREFIVAHPEAKVGPFDYLKCKRLIQKRKKGVPVAYLTGHKEFYGLDFVVNKNVLVPRPETEVLVDAVIEHGAWNPPHRRAGTKQKIILIDVGTGSGCIPVAIAKTMGKIGKIFAIDISKKALKIAKKNAERHGVEIEFLHGNLLEPFISHTTYHIPHIKTIQQLIITANLPYLTEQRFCSEPSIQHEPESALVAPNNGLGLYHSLLKQIVQLPNRPITSFFEIDPSQSSRITTLIHEYIPSATVKIKKDLAGRDRVVIVKQL